MDKIRIDDYNDALNSVIYYNGLGKYVKNWKNIPNNGCILPLIRYGTNNSKVENQLQVIWMIAVSLFGNYGTSPRSGWIESKRYKDFCDWIDEICKDCEDK